MNTRPKLTALTCALAALSALASGAAVAGPSVGSVVGAPSSTSQTIQAKVISATPVVAQVAVPRQVCYDQLQQEPPRSSGAGAVLGAIAGGVMGNALGKGAGNVLATGAGVIGGAILGDHVENDGRQGTTRTVRRCEQQSSYENQVVAYDVVYEYAGQRYSTQMQQEPGRTIPLQVTVSPLGMAAPAAPVVMAPQVVNPPVVVAPATYYQPGYYGPSYYPQGQVGVTISNGRGWYGGPYRGHRWD